MRPWRNKKFSRHANHKHHALLPFSKCPRASDADNGISGFITTVWDFQVPSLFCHFVLSTCASARLEGTPLIDARHD